MIRKLILGLMLISTSILATTNTSACDLKLENTVVSGKSCQQLVGYYNGHRVGPFQYGNSDQRIYAGTCDGFAGVIKIDGNTISVAASGPYPARTYRLSEDCKQGTWVN
jgi:hypothetical protein